ncbi:hypothetical protein [Streptomyces collinus]|uniref:Uncharacterized protein n=1 Tax=Streptomyces collinus TaxID=42684 RepID=A0AA89Q5Z4_STRCU|nr:hypothetical protein [Streptomyces collinus]MBB5810951.1 hypothetical protein [Streptomyces collinus]WMX64209.1 hypothetical protein RFN52_12880 [Streptomyces collinus]
MDRLKAQASKNRDAAKVLRSRGKGTAAKQMEARADELESGRVTDVTDSVVGLFRWAQGG